MSLLNRALLWSIKQPLAAGAIFLFVTVFFAFQLSRLQIDASVEGLMLDPDRLRARRGRAPPLFAGLSRWEARKVVLLGMLRPLAVGEYVIRKGEQGRDLFMVVTGRMLITDFEASGMERTIAIVDPGGVFGESGFAGDGFRATSARAATPCEVLRIDFDALERLRRRFPYTAAKVFRNLARILSERLQDTTTALLYLSSADIVPAEFHQR